MYYSSPIWVQCLCKSISEDSCSISMFIVFSEKSGHHLLVLNGTFTVERVNVEIRLLVIHRWVFMNLDIMQFVGHTLVNFTFKFTGSDSSIAVVIVMRAIEEMEVHLGFILESHLFFIPHCYKKTPNSSF